MGICTRTGCTNSACWTPVLLFRFPPLTMPIEANMNLPVCTECMKILTLEDLMDDKGWQWFLENLPKREFPPERSLTTLLWNSIN